MANSEIEQLSIDTIRTLSMDAVQKANAGHPGTAMALAPLAYLLYAEVLRHNPANSHWQNRDRFVLSAGHACVLQYSALHLTGYDLSLDDLKQFRQWAVEDAGPSRVRAHRRRSRSTTGPLGQGFANGVGMAIAERFLAGTFNRPQHELVDHRVYVICSDGDLMEGVSYEAGSIAGTNGLGKLIYFYDDNHITIDGTTSISFTEDRAKRFDALGWHVQSVADVQRSRRVARGDLERAGRDGAAVDDHRALAHRLRRAARSRHGRCARLAARRRGGRRDEARPRLGSRQAVLRPARGRRAHGPDRARRAARARVARRSSTRGRRHSPASASGGTPPGPGGSARGRRPPSRPARSSRRARPARP